MHSTRTNDNTRIEMPTAKATLKIETKTRDRLKELSRHMEDTFDSIISRLIDDYEKHERGNKK